MLFLCPWRSLINHADITWVRLVRCFWWSHWKMWLLCIFHNIIYFLNGILLFAFIPRMWILFSLEFLFVFCCRSTLHRVMTTGQERYSVFPVCHFVDFSYLVYIWIKLKGKKKKSLNKSASELSSSVLIKHKRKMKILNLIISIHLLVIELQTICWLTDLWFVRWPSLWTQTQIALLNA